MRQFVWDILKVMIIFLGCTFLFYFGLRAMHHEYEEYHRYDQTEGPAVKYLMMKEHFSIGSALSNKRRIDMLKDALDDFFHFLRIERGLSQNTITSYRRDLDQ